MPLKVKLGQCDWPDCDEPKLYSRGLCRTHYRARYPSQNQRRCSVVGCDRPHSARGYCASHYTQLVQKTNQRNEAASRGFVDYGKDSACPKCHGPMKGSKYRVCRTCVDKAKAQDKGWARAAGARNVGDATTY